MNAVAGAGIDADEFVTFADLDGVQDANGLAAAALCADADFAKCLDVGKRASVEDGKLKVVELHDHVVHSHADQGREQMLGGGDQNALAHQTGRVADLGDVAADGGNFKVVEISTPKDDARTGRSRKKPHRDRCAGVESDPCEFQGCCNGLFQVRWVCQITTPNKSRVTELVTQLLD